MKIINYCVVQDDSATGLQVAVYTLIKGYWQPLGGVSASSDSNGKYTYAQAMVRYQLAPNELIP